MIHVADRFTHMLAAMSIAVIASWRYGWITPPLVVACMVGAAIPDLSRVDLILPADTITALIGLPWSWDVLHRAGGAILVAIIFVLLVREDLRLPVFAMLTVGIGSHFVIDYFMWQPTATTNLMRWPFLDVTAPTRGSIVQPIVGRPSSLPTRDRRPRPRSNRHSTAMSAEQS